MDGALGTVVIVAALSLLPFALVMLTSFIKVVVVMSLLRNALGTPQVPPGIVITGLALVLSAFIMAPVAADVIQAVEPAIDQIDQTDQSDQRDRRDAGGAADDADAPGPTRRAVARYTDLASRAVEPVRRFLARHAHARDREVFRDLAVTLRASHAAEPDAAEPDAAESGGEPDAAEPSGEPDAAEPIPPDISDTDLLVLAPAFVTSELSEAFAIGFLLLLPFLIVDLVVASALASLGMTSLSPAAVSLPIKLLLFVLADGWVLVAHGLVLGYA